MKFWQFIGAVLLLLIAGSILYRVIYALRTGRDLDADRVASVLMARNARASGVQTQPAVPAGNVQDLTQTNSSVGSTEQPFWEVL